MTVYLIHPLQGDGSLEAFERNKALVAGLCRQIAALGHCPVSPAHAFGWLDDHTPADRLLALALCLELLGTCDAVWVFGDWRNSQGCQMEIEAALGGPMPVAYMTAGYLAAMKEAYEGL